MPVSRLPGLVRKLVQCKHFQINESYYTIIYMILVKIISGSQFPDVTLLTLAEIDATSLVAAAFEGFARSSLPSQEI